MPDKLWARLRRRTWRIVGGASISFKILGMVLALVVLLSLCIGIVVRLSLEEMLRRQLRTQALTVAHHIAAHAADPAVFGNPASLQRMAQDTLDKTPGVRYVIVINASGNEIASVGAPRQAGLTPTSAQLQATLGDSATRMDTPSGAIWEGVATLAPTSGGLALVGMDESGLWATVAETTARIAISTVLFAVVGILAAFGLTWVLTRPILDLVSAADQVARGDYSARATPWSNDEVGWLAVRFNHMAKRLAEAEAERAERERLRQSYLEAVIQAQEEERRRIARELHDETGQALASLMVGLHNAEAVTNNPETQRYLAELRRETTTAMAQVRRLAVELRPSVLDDLGLEPALRRYVQDFGARHGITVALRSVGLERWRGTPETETTVYRIVQEALTNAAKHAECSRISVLLQLREDLLTVIVEDNGRGFDVTTMLAADPDHSRLGLYGMQERAALVGGQLDIESRPGSGTTIYVRVPATPGPVPP